MCEFMKDNGNIMEQKKWRWTSEVNISVTDITYFMCKAIII